MINRVEGWSRVTGPSTAPIAVLIDGATGSSVEGAALSLIGRATARTFGSRTYGVASANERVELSDGMVM
ncbi:S41 family peptidase [Brevundimonas sp.]|uniref:S41 family peptidase n=1 Tax=Brevundimonas sp. TaxID=1871086 RepID=UPI0035651215